MHFLSCEGSRWRRPLSPKPGRTWKSRRDLRKNKTKQKQKRKEKKRNRQAWEAAFWPVPSQMPQMVSQVWEPRAQRVPCFPSISDVALFLSLGSSIVPSLTALSPSPVRPSTSYHSSVFKNPSSTQTLSKEGPEPEPGGKRKKNIFNVQMLQLD